jgi:hypothetical protein
VRLKRFCASHHSTLIDGGQSFNDGAYVLPLARFSAPFWPMWAALYLTSSRISFASSSGVGASISLISRFAPQAARNLS